MLLQKPKNSKIRLLFHNNDLNATFLISKKFLYYNRQIFKRSDQHEIASSAASI